MFKRFVNMWLSCTKNNSDEMKQTDISSTCVSVIWLTNPALNQGSWWANNLQYLHVYRNAIRLTPSNRTDGVEDVMSQSVYSSRMSTPDEHKDILFLTHIDYKNPSWPCILCESQIWFIFSLSAIFESLLKIAGLNFSLSHQL